MLEVRDLSSGYNKLVVLHSLTLRADQGCITAVIGPNGAGKSTLMLSIVGALWTDPRSCVLFEGEDITRVPTHLLAQRGLRIVTETTNLFTAMSVRENLLLGAGSHASRGSISSALDRIYGIFPHLRERASQYAETLSGGERKMLAIGRAMMAEPRLLLVDEPSLGLAPKAAQDLFAKLGELNAAGMTIVIVEQNVRLALDVASYVYVLERGELVCEGAPDEIAKLDRIQRDYLVVH